MSNRDFFKGIAVSALLVVSVGTGMLLGVKLNRRDTVLSDRNFLNKLAALESMIDDYYLNEPDEEKLKEGLYTGLVYGLGDPYSRYYTAEEYEEENTSTQGMYVGIGILMQKNPMGGVRIVECYEGGPGEAAGLKAGDIISAVNGTDITDSTVAEAADLLKGRDGETMTLTVLHEDAEDTVEIAVAVTDVELPSVFHEMLDEDTGYIRISEFKGVTHQQYQKAFADLEVLGMENLVVDLRGNPGGLLTSVCDILRDILPEGLIVYTEDKYGNRMEERCDGENPLKMPLAVLVNESSASASEIFAGAVQDYGVGTIVGTTTFGKGIVQEIHTLRDGSALKLTVSNYYTPKGNNIHKVGIRPDIEVKPDAALLNKEEISHEEDNQLQAAIAAVSKEDNR